MFTFFVRLKMAHMFDLDIDIAIMVLLTKPILWANNFFNHMANLGILYNDYAQKTIFIFFK